MHIRHVFTFLSQSHTFVNGHLTNSQWERDNNNISWINLLNCRCGFKSTCRPLRDQKGGSTAQKQCSFNRMTQLKWASLTRDKQGRVGDVQGTFPASSFKFMGHWLGCELVGPWWTCPVGSSNLVLASGRETSHIHRQIRVVVLIFHCCCSMLLKEFRHQKLCWVMAKDKFSLFWLICAGQSVCVGS